MAGYEKSGGMVRWRSTAVVASGRGPTEADRDRVDGPKLVEATGRCDGQ